ncbi:hypothetical protein GX888_02165 [Candidatus Dojkabacteria bacterium]|uniref:N-acetyl sugar amidotransferase n=1 Tax=Candidatus Dojkabacteria bacterium TaxID=2099670 RepID=A0A847VDF3_9BACT|nr:hypothetical protein [Candidatus Dojkabacteria bacterium]
MNRRDVKTITKLVEEEYNKRYKQISQLNRCSKCLLPETMPFIEFDKNNVCNYCRDYGKIGYEGAKALEKKLKTYRRDTDKPDCIVAFSGGRDSSYALHYLVKEMDMNPLVYTYDWGMITDVGFRNMDKMIDKLAVKSVVIKADIDRKRKNIRLNINAWLKRPNLGTVPLFMAGDKQFFYHAAKLSRERGLDLVILSENLLEVTYFKTGFCGVKPKHLKGKKFYILNVGSLLRLLSFYGKEYLLNPLYINSSLLDSIAAFSSYYVMPHNHLSLFSYIEWDENHIEDVLINQYGWERATDTDTTWRIGDGTAAFYNYLYYILSGFSEIDTFRSNQIREGKMDRDEALTKVNKENRPRIESMIWYADVIGFDLLEALKIIHNEKPLYEKNN